MILLSRGYAGYLAGTIVQLPAQEEASLIAQGFGVSHVSELPDFEVLLSTDSMASTPLNIKVAAHRVVK